MASVRIGYRRLYDSMGCSIVGEQTINLVFPFGEHIQAEIYMGNKPKFGITVETGHEDYFIPGTQAILGQYTYHADATQSSYPRTFFTEITCSQVEEVSDDLFNAFCRNDQTACQELLSKAEKHANDYYIAIDLLSGVIGLRFHPQFIIKLLNENFIAFRDEQHAHSHAGSGIQILEPIQLNQTGMNTMTQIFPEIGNMEAKVKHKSSRISGWLIRTWREQDIISKFNTLFIPLEMILDGIRGEIPQDQRQQVDRLQNLIDTYGGNDKEKKAMKALLDRLVKNQRPSLIDRFSIFAKQANLPGWENDIEAFKKFNSIRNGLIHRGDPNVKIYVEVSEEETQALEDLAERYVNYFLFRDTNVYQSSFLQRPKPSTA